MEAVFKRSIHIYESGIKDESPGIFESIDRMIKRAVYKSGE